MIAIGIAPLISVALTGLIAELTGCQVREDFVRPCIVFGANIGGLLSFMGMMGWFMLITIYLVAVGLLGLALEAVLLIVKKFRSQ